MLTYWMMAYRDHPTLTGRADNIDYNSLKHHIKVHTTKNQATAIAIPGRQGTGLRTFEDELYAELCRQHDRVDLFVSSKADEIARRLRECSPYSLCSPIAGYAANTVA